MTCETRPGQVRLIAVIFSALGMLVAFLALLSTPAAAQTLNAEVAGVIQDTQNAAIPKVEIKMVEQTRGSTFKTRTSADGSYQIIGMPAGVYRFEASTANFKTLIVPNIVLAPNVQKHLDGTLEVGIVTQSITVVDQAPAIETQKPTLQTSVPEIATATGHPLVGFSVMGGMSAAMILPGTAPGEVYKFGSGHMDQQQFTFDGQEFDTYFMGAPDTAGASVELILNNASAEYARPVTGSVRLRSGSNKYHGIYESYLTNYCLNAVASPWFQRSPDQPAHLKGSCPTSWSESFSVGGPFRIPKVYDGRNKSFFFFSYAKAFTKNAKIPTFTSAPSLEMQQGNYSHYPKIIIDPLTGVGFPGNIIPPNRISPVFTALNNLTFGSNSPMYSYLGPPSSYLNNLASFYMGGGPYQSLSFKVDQNIGQSDVLSFSLIRTKNESFTNSSATYYPPNSWAWNQNNGALYTLADTHTFGTGIMNEIRVGATRQKFAGQPTFGDPVNGQAPPVSGARTGPEWLTLLGIQGIPNAPDLVGVPVFQPGNWEGAAGVGNWPYNFSGSFSTGLRYQSIYELTDNLFIKRGSHGIKVGWYSRNYAHDSSPFAGWGSWAFGNYTTDGRFTGDSFADFQLGLLGDFGYVGTRPWKSNRIWETGAYVQDDWHLSSRLTLNLGFRLEHEGAPYDRNGLYSNAKIDFNTGAVQIVVPDQKALSNVSPLWPSNVLPVTAAAVGYPTRLLNSSTYPEPRVGFAWRPFGGDKTVIRGGYGLYSGLLLFNALNTGGPFQVASDFSNHLVPTAVTPQTPLGLTPQYQFPNPFTTGGTAPVVNSATMYSTRTRGSTVHNAHLTYEHMLSGNWALRGTFSLTRTTGISIVSDLNLPTLSTIPWSQSRERFPQWRALNYIDPGGSAWYDAAELEISHPWGHGLWFQANYTYRYDTADTNFCYNNTFGGTCEQYQNYPYDRKRQYGPSGSEWSQPFPKNQFIANWVWEAPVGTGQRWGGNLSSRGVGGKLLNAVVGGWSTAANINMRTGLPFTVTYSGSDPGGINLYSGDWASLVPGCNVYANQSTQGFSGGLWFQSSCFKVPDLGTLGNSGRNHFRGPGAWTVNFNPYKSFKLGFLGEGGRLEIGANISNLFNHPNYGFPDGNITSASAGKIMGGASFAWAGQRSIGIRGKVQF